MSLKRQRSPSSAAVQHEIWHSTQIEDRSSLFIAYFSPTMPPRILQSQPDLETASHRMLAWRTPSSQRTIPGAKAASQRASSAVLDKGSDDDGEKYGAKRVLNVLEDMRVEGSCVVARWYGGIMLGPVRFTHIEDATRDVVRAWRQGEASDLQKRRKVEDEVREKEELVADLRERDGSIRVLRGLLEDATNAARGGEGGKEGVASVPVSAPVREIDYASMTLERLRQMDKARDGTVAFLLKRIDETEKQNAAVASVEAGEIVKEGVSTPEKAVDGIETIGCVKEADEASKAAGHEVEAGEASKETQISEVKHDGTERKRPDSSTVAEKLEIEESKSLS